MDAQPIDIAEAARAGLSAYDRANIERHRPALTLSAVESAAHRCAVEIARIDLRLAPAYAAAGWAGGSVSEVDAERTAAVSAALDRHGIASTRDVAPWLEEDARAEARGALYCPVLFKYEDPRHFPHPYALFQRYPYPRS